MKSIELTGQERNIVYFALNDRYVNTRLSGEYRDQVREIMDKIWKD